MDGESCWNLLHYPHDCCLNSNASFLICPLLCFPPLIVAFDFARAACHNTDLDFHEIAGKIFVEVEFVSWFDVFVHRLLPQHSRLRRESQRLEVADKLVCRNIRLSLNFLECETLTGRKVLIEQ